MWKRSILWLIMMGMSSVMAILICELAIRLWGVMDQSPDVFAVNPEMIDHITFNADGMRDRDYTSDKAPDVFRILVLGDSITFGVSVEADQTYVKQLETLLNTDNRLQKFEVMNYGVPGWNTLYERTYLKAEGIRYQPDLVIIGFCLNDAEPDQPPPDLFLNDALYDSHPDVLPTSAEKWLTPFLDWKKSANLAPSGPGFSRLIKNFLAKHSHLYRFIRWRYDMLMRRIDNYDEYPRALYRENTESWQACQSSLHDIARIMDARQVPVVLVIFPFFIKLKQHAWFNDGAYPWQDLHRRLTLTGQEAQMVVVDLLPYYLGFDPRDISVDPYHPNPQGHRMAAEAIYAALVKEDLIPLHTTSIHSP